jgi:hypothetical protein
VTPDPLPPDLLALERDLADRPRPEPSAELRGRVVAAARRERHRPARAGFPRFAAAVAAAALVAINLSASVANDTDWGLRRPPDRRAVGDTADRIRELAPDLPDREVVRQMLLLNAAVNLVPAPAPAPPVDGAFWNKESDRWGTR